MCQHRRNLGYVARLVQIVDDQGRNLAAAVDIQSVEAVDHDTAAAKGARLHLERPAALSLYFQNDAVRMGTRQIGDAE